ncbi:MAG: hypothetical protein NW203_11575 [Hyphomonadaceae bacterium]|nr:hypothetical protein [Hyphomonadaceae bacterium]
MSEEPRSPLKVRTRLPFETNAHATRAALPAFAIVYGMLAACGAGAAAYMALIEDRPIMSGYVLAPAFGAAWFALRAAMSFGRR